MGFTQPELDNIAANCPGDTAKYITDVLIAWRNKNSDEPDIRGVII